MLKRFFFLSTLCLLLPFAYPAGYAATFPAPADVTQPAPVVKKANLKKGVFAKWKQKLVAKAVKKGWLAEGDMTERQRKWAKWSMYLGLGGLVLLFVPYVSFLAIPAAIVALIFGIKSVEGNSNTQGIIGIIAGGLTLLLLILAIAVLVAFLASWE